VFQIFFPNGKFKMGVKFKILRSQGMIEIDGSHGEGGGQIIRTAISLSSLTLKPIRIINIRAGRPNPGLRRQHIAGIELVGKLVDARIKGLEVSSTEVAFLPRERQGGKFHYDIGTAGSISLVLQAVLPPAVLAPEPVILHLKGGTDVSWSPPVDYLQEVFVSMLKRMGTSIEILQKRRGHYPKGGGKVVCSVNPVDEIRPLELIQFDELKEVKGISHCVRLPAHVAMRQSVSAQQVLQAEGIEPIILTTETYPKGNDPHLGPGSGIVLWAESNDGIRLGADSLGKKGLPAEKVGALAGTQLLEELSTGMAIDSHLCDMLVPYLAMAAGSSKIGISAVTSHLRTNIWVVEQFLKSKMILEGDIGNPGILSVIGTGLSFSERR
jgi:RNA 3'-phosphate cyclase